jgi:hypothetical protein
MYFQQATKAHYREEFIKAIVNEMNDLIVNKHWELVRRYDIPNGEKVLEYVWDMRRKRDIKNQKVLRYKTSLNMHGGEQDYDVNYLESYSPVVAWASVCLITTLAW